MGTKNKLTKTLRNNLLTAIDLATHPRACQYVKDNQPCCIIGQLAHLEGLSVGTLEKWDKMHVHKDGTVESNDIISILTDKAYGSKALKKYPSELLEKIQMIWDTRSGEDEQLRYMCKLLVEEFYNEQQCN